MSFIQRVVNREALLYVYILSLSLHLTGKNFELDSNPVVAELNESTAAVRLGGVRINYLDPGEENKSFIMEITNVTFLKKRGKSLSLDQELNNCLFVHKILNQTEVVIVKNDGMLYIYIMYVLINVLKVTK